MNIKVKIKKLLLLLLLSRAPDAYCAQPKKTHLFAFIVCRLSRYIGFFLLLFRSQHVSLRVYFDLLSMFCYGFTSILLQLITAITSI